MNAWLNLAHPAEGEWRAYLDGELPSARHQYLDRHLAGCARCRSRFAEVQKTAALAAARLGALRTLSEVAPTPPFPAHLRSGPERPVTLKEAPHMVRFRFTGRVAAAAAALALVSSLFIPNVRAAAAEWLTVFRAKDARVLRINPADFKPGSSLNVQGIAAEQLQKLVQIEQTRKPAQRQGLALDELKGYSFRAPASLPEGYAAAAKGGTYMGQGEALVKLDVDGINQILSMAGSKAQLPAELKGQVVRINAGPTAGMVYEKGEQRLMVMQTGAPTLAASGQVDINKTADLLMSSLGTELGLPTSIQTQLRSMDLSRTFPLPVVEGQGDEVKVKGLTGAYYSDQQGNGAVVWMSHGQIRVVQGPLSRQELLKVAESLED
jgi:hypothetical protein